MSKVKIIQIAVALSESESNELYLDDKGRVWYVERVQLKDDEGSFINNWKHEWKQTDLPDEPKEES